MELFSRSVTWLSRLFGVLSAGMILVSVLIVCQMVFVRYVLGHSTIWQTPFVTYMLVAATFLGSPYVLVLKGHVNVDIFPIYMKRRGRMALAFIAAMVGLTFAIIVFWYGTHFWYEAFSKGWKSSSVWKIPVWVPYLALPVGMGLLALQYVVEIYNLATGRDEPFGIASVSGDKP